MTSWIFVIIVGVAFSIVISHINTLRKNASKPLRKQALNDKKPTITLSGIEPQQPNRAKNKVE